MEIKKYKDIDEILKKAPRGNPTIGENLIIAWAKINSPLYDKIKCSISGGWDSDILMDVVWRCDLENKVDYVWFDTGLEYQATKDHLKFLEQKYGIEIKPYKAIKPIPLTCKQYGQPFLSKRVSDYMSRLQKHGFKWEDRPFKELCKKYPKCEAALKWWCNEWGGGSSFNIKRNRYLKEFIIENPPQFLISDKCCKHAKKDVGDKCMKENGYQLDIIGVRKAEGGNRKDVYKTCFDDGDDWDRYRPLFWYKNKDKEIYDNHYGVTHSKCYTEYGLKRTGCAGCPFGRDFEYELEVIKKYEPKLFKAVMNIFGDSYEYTRMYRKFCEEMKQKENPQ